MAKIRLDGASKIIFNQLYNLHKQWNVTHLDLIYDYITPSIALAANECPSLTPAPELPTRSTKPTTVLSALSQLRLKNMIYLTLTKHFFDSFFKWCFCITGTEHVIKTTIYYSYHIMFLQTFRPCAENLWQK